MKKYILIYLLLVMSSCKNEKINFIRISDDPIIEYSKIGDQIYFYSSYNKMNSEENKLNSEAISLIKERKFKKAQNKFIEALSKHPNNVIILNNLGNIELNYRNFDKAIEYFNNSIVSSDSTYFPAEINLGKLYGKLGEDKKAEKIYNHIIENSDINFLKGAAHLGLANMYLDYGWIDKAKISTSKSKKLLTNYKDMDDLIEEIELEIKTYYN